MESQFEKCQYPQGPQREQIARQLSLTDTKVQIWFKNRRAKVRQKKKFEDELQKAHQNHQLKRESTDEDLRMPSMDNNNTDVEDKMHPSQINHHSIGVNSQPHSANHTPTLLQPLQPSTQSHEIMSPFPTMPFMLTSQNMAELNGIKIETLASDASSLLSANADMTNAIGTTPFGHTNPAAGKNTLFF